MMLMWESEMNNIKVWLWLVFLLVSAAIITIIGVAAFIPHAVFRMCNTARKEIEKKLDSLEMEV